MLIFPEMLEKNEVEDLNQVAEEIERFFKEKGCLNLSALWLSIEYQLMACTHRMVAEHSINGDTSFPIQCSSLFYSFTDMEAKPLN